MKTFSRDELQRTMDGWPVRTAWPSSTAIGSPTSPLLHRRRGHRWNVGPNEEFVARGRKEIEEVGDRLPSERLSRVELPYEKAILIDEKLGEMVAFWRQVAPVKCRQRLRGRGCGRLVVQVRRRRQVVRATYSSDRQRARASVSSRRTVT
ncbi:MAG: hypothetical protein R3B99_28745 [Polyangiales bacterium]